ncbi:SDR family NAD(P)-dependent oxidoreductase [Marinobacter salicampi]|uniref:SDR family NAD(P)-dependent oxidoreductase n=1 Tax=Marinobacter salicampi TaxID=435907 RepID=UPI0014097A5E|nr:SDR family NAD(P)-dependent oxidoreductase [Marinobacter salicampi]
MSNILLAGATGGIGRAIANHLLEKSEVKVWGLCRAPAQEADWLARHEGRLALGSWDASRPERFQGNLKALLPEGLEVTGLIYAAGVLHGQGLKPEKRLEDLDPANLVHSYGVNAAAFPMLTQALLPWLRHSELVRLMALSAKVGSLTDNRMGGWYAYRASKAALNMFVRNLAVEMPRRIRRICCVAVHPGTTHTRLSAPFTQSLAQLNVHEPDSTGSNMVRIFDSLTERDNGRFINWDGSDLPW